MKILIVDDEISSVKIIQKFLPMQEYPLEITGIAADGADALNYLHSTNPPDLVITDMNMPAMDGISLLQYLLNCHPEIRIIVISGYYDFEYTHAAIKANAYDYLLKPIDPKKLRDAVGKCYEEYKQQGLLLINNTEKKMHVDLKLYQTLLKHANQLNTILDYGKTANLNDELDMIQNFISDQHAPEGLYELVYTTLTDALVRYCVVGNYAPPEIPALNLCSNITLDHLFDTIRDIYTQCLAQIIEKRNGTPTAETLRLIRDYIEEHYMENISLETVSDRFFMNKEYLSTLFRKKYGETVGGYIIRLKIEAAKRQLEHSDRTIDQIADSLGYTDSCYFSRQFRKNTGISPGKYRSQSNKNQLL